ncbi:PBECR2 nuclease fold domain-containing protein [Pseudorhodobacter sp.]|uniref:PBECR2 nuclease fold domain-containing protein n=1 Tax=Pseudorhodobacter sp. TaxID=1934400 RepID=UPI0026480272|nr:PBECR2 nuclease fold domain-containing protein [Pseudorhodobacter sp.]MDN5785737.1 head morphogenesis protein [Pseudorhodobacter sp.]
MLLGQAMELAALEGREAVYAEAFDGKAYGEPDFSRQEFREQIDFLTQKRPKPTRVWTDAMHGMHDRSFVVAGANDIAMLEEFHAAMIEGARTYDIKAFGSEFDRIVEKYGWSYNGGRNWRVRTIFETNIRTSYMAGRLKQMRDPELVKLQPYWLYRHADTRVPKSPRALHVSWDGLVLAWDDPWWDIYFPPNDWVCSCGVHGLSRGDLRRLGKAGPDKAPEIVRKPFTHEASGVTVDLPEGTGYGWDYMPGDQWERGLVPSALLNDPAASPTGDLRGHNLVSIDLPEPIADLVGKAKPFTATVLQPGLPMEDYVRAFLEPFGAKPGEAKLWQDAAGQKLVISDDLFRAHSGGWKGLKRGHGDHAALLAEAIMDPDEIWLGLREVPVLGLPDYVEQMITRRYIRVDPKTALQVLYEVGQKQWGAVTGYASFNRSKPDYRHIDKQRVGKLLWKRK